MRSDDFRLSIPADHLRSVGVALSAAQDLLVEEAAALLHAMRGAQDGYPLWVEPTDPAVYSRKIDACAAEWLTHESLVTQLKSADLGWLCESRTREHFDAAVHKEAFRRARRQEEDSLSPTQRKHLEQDYRTYVLEAGA